MRKKRTKDSKKRSGKNIQRNRSRQFSSERERRRNKSARGRREIPEHLRCYLTGIIDGKSSGKAYLLPDDPNIEDVFIAANNTNHALHGDHVKVLLFPQRSGRRMEGQVVEIIQRNKNMIVGLLEKEGSYYFLIPDNSSIPVDILIPKENLNGGQSGEKALVHITEWPVHFNNPIGEVEQVLGKPGDNNVEMQSILADYNFPLSYPENAVLEAQKLSIQLTEKEMKLRRDFREVFTCTIDPSDAKDFDDALSCRQLENGNLEIGVHIADVSYFVRPDGDIDREAYERGTSVYLVDRTIGMLPEKLSDDLCSLRPDEDRFAFSVVYEMNEKGEILDTWMGKTVIRSNLRLAYEEVQEYIETGTSGILDKEAQWAIDRLYSISRILREKRFQTGTINFHTQEVKFKLDPVTAKPLGVYIKEQKEANFLIEEFMLQANRSVAEFIGKKKNRKDKTKPFVYRVHDEPNVEKLNQFVEFVHKLGYKMNQKNKRTLIQSYNDLLDDVQGKAEQNMIETIAVRTMSKAYYSTQNIGHYGLSFNYYTHFTSPIRRYPDLMVHRLLYDYLRQMDPKSVENLEEYCEHCSDMERKAAEAERTSVKYKQAEFLADKIGETFFGVISGVSKWGIFVALEDNYCEGMVALKSMKDDFYELDEDNYRVVGLRTHRIYKLGDRVEVRVKNVNLNKKEIDLEFIS